MAVVKVAHRGKKFVEASKLVDESKSYTIEEAVGLVKKASFVKFDETVELHLRMGLDPRAADQQVRGTVPVPHGLGKKVRILVFTQGEAIRAAEAAGADVVGGDELIKKVEEGWTEFDVAIATQDVMNKVGRLGKVLGRKGLMPNPKSGTVAPPSDIARVIQEARQGRVEFRLDRSAIIHLAIGKVSFEPNKLVENLVAIVEAIGKAKPAGAKGQYIKSAFLTSTMGPGVRIDMRSLMAAAGLGI
jgi:large subunit ribosomal protein L1